MDAITLSANNRNYILTPQGTNALCALEERWGKSFGALMSELGVLGIEHMRLSTVRLFFQECMHDKPTETDIGDLIDALGFDGISKAVNGLIVPGTERP